MQKNVAKFIRGLFVVALVFVVCAANLGVYQAFAADNGIYTAPSYPHYRHPYTGVIEDSGGEDSYVLGQSMTESVLVPSALVEVDSAGNTFVTVRMGLMSSITNVNFQVDAAGDGNFYGVSHAVMQENYGANTADFRMQVPSEFAVIRCNMFVLAMDREVIFYITLGGLTAGSGDFVTSVVVEEPAPEPEPEPVPEPEAAETTTTVETATENPSDEEATDTSQETATAETTDSSSEDESEEESESKPDDEDSEESSSTSGISEFDKGGNEVSQNSSSDEESAEQSSHLMAYVIAGIAVIVLGTVIYIVIKRRKRKS